MKILKREHNYGATMIVNVKYKQMQAVYKFLCNNIRSWVITETDKMKEKELIKKKIQHIFMVYIIWLFSGHHF